MHSTRRLGFMASLFMVLSSLGCPTTRDEGLIVNVQTDYVPVVEFDAVRVQLDDGAMRDVTVSARDRFSRPRYVTTYSDAVRGRRVVAVSLVRRGREIARRTVQLAFNGSYLVTVVLTRSCAAVTCDTGTSCFGFRCVPPECIVGDEAACLRPECTSSASCMSTTPCVESECISGACFQRPNDARCAASELCVPGMGCVTRPSDPDAFTAADVGSVDAFDGRCRGPADCADAFSCTSDACNSGMCGNDANDAACPGSACVPTDPGADRVTGCLPVCNATTCVPSACETASCVAGRCERTPTCAIGESCCSGTCALDCGAVLCAGRPAGTLCRAAAGVCDVAETCDGTSPECPPDGLATSATVCRAAAGACDVAERCTTGTADCTPDAFVMTGTACPSGSCDGLGLCSSACTPGAPCSTGNPCEVGAFACGPTRCVAMGAAPAATPCRAAVGPCDVQETCGGGTTCPADLFDSSSVCRGARGVCDVAEACNGAGPSCPTDAVRPGTQICRTASGTCDAEERCVGGDDCPANSFLSGSVCRAGGECDPAEACSGFSANCPTDDFSNSSTVCRAVSGDCDVAESCTGVSRGCPADTVRSGVCRISAGPCDVPETCSGASPACPGDSFVSGGVCRASAGACDVAEACSGASAACPGDNFASGICRLSAGLCDVAESCTGASATCPGDSFASGGVCRPATGPCDFAESCSGLSASCPSDVGGSCCGNGVCEGALGEDCATCALDCAVCPPPACMGTAGGWPGCRGNGCAVCNEQVAAYPRYFINHPACARNLTCAGMFFECNSSCPAPTAADL